MYEVLRALFIAKFENEFALESLDSNLQEVLKNDFKIKRKTIVSGLTFLIYILLGLISIIQTYQSSIFIPFFGFYLFNTFMLINAFKSRNSMNLTNFDFISSFYVTTNSIITVFILFQRFSFVLKSSHHVSIPIDVLIYIITSPIINVYLFGNLSWKILMRSWCINISTLSVFSLFFLPFGYYPLIITLFYIPFSYLILHENHCQGIQSFLEINKLKQDIILIKAQCVNDIAEMQSMLGNVTHDLKTPLAGVTSGLDSIRYVVTDCQKLLQIDNNTPSPSSSSPVSSSSFNKDKFSQCISSIAETAKHMDVVNYFMLETIHRFLDFSKSQNGMKLVPKNETVSIIEALSLPITCIRAMQSKIKIEVSPFVKTNTLPLTNSAICSHIITDKQWLQENLLCLLSNAVKYSSRGTITVSLSVVCSSTLVSRHAKSKSIDEDTNGGVYNTTSYDDHPSTTGSNTGSTRTTNTGILYTASNDELDNEQMFTQSSHGLSSPSSSLLNVNNSNNNSNKYMLRQSTSCHANMNAAAATTAGVSSKKSQRIHKRANTESLLVEIEDTGIGISEDVMLELFSPFKQAQRLAGGTGLGLYSLGKRLDALNGAYGVKKRNDGQAGSNFWFAVPYKADWASGEEILDFNDSVLPCGLVKPSLSRSRVTSPGQSNYNLNAAAGVGAGIGIDGGAICDTNTNCSSNTSTEGGSSNGGDSPRGRLSRSGGSATSLSCGSLNKFTRRITSTLSIGCNLSQIGGGGGGGSHTENTHTKSLNILLVDDSMSILKMTGTVLARFGHVVTEATNGSEALEILANIRNKNSGSTPFDIIVMDLQMPVMDGLECATRLRTLEQELVLTNPDYVCQKIVICSANADDTTTDLAYEVGIDAFIEKPLTMQTFNSVYEEISMSLRKSSSKSIVMSTAAVAAAAAARQNERAKSHEKLPSMAAIRELMREDDSSSQHSDYHSISTSGTSKVVVAVAVSNPLGDYDCVSATGDDYYHRKMEMNAEDEEDESLIPSF